MIFHPAPLSPPNDPDSDDILQHVFVSSFLPMSLVTTAPGSKGHVAECGTVDVKLLKLPRQLQQLRRHRDETTVRSLNQEQAGTFQKF